ncbi:MAG: DNA-binding protein [Pseudolysinimonas sp.]|uniref:DNA-binding protein n=1 Tax=Pseudolysinimonas sp. TaxID=2680009 RepID=UPI0032673DF8
MFVITSDQVDSQHHSDRVDNAIRQIEDGFGPALVGRPERTAGDEFQVATRAGDAALEIALLLVRAGDWSVGMGIGGVRHPLGASVRAMTGTAFVNARDAVTAAKKRPARFALVADRGLHAAQALDPLIRLLLAVRDRRTAEGWELFDLTEAEQGLTQSQIAKRLGISPQAASQRALIAGVKLDREAREALSDALRTEGERIEA